MTAITNGTISYLREKKYNMYTGLTVLFLHLSLFKNIVTFLCRFCFFSVQHFAARKQGVHFSPKVILLIFSARCHRSRCSVQMPSVSIWHSFLMQYIKESHLQAKRTQLKISVIRTNKMRSLRTFKKKKKQQSFSSVLKCLHYSDTNGRNYNIINIRIIIIHFGLSPVQYNN